MDWTRFSNPSVDEAIAWRTVMGVPTMQAAGIRIELFKETVRELDKRFPARGGYEGFFRDVVKWRYRISGTPRPGTFETKREAKAQAELHARRIIASRTTQRA